MIALVGSNEILSVATVVATMSAWLLFPQSLAAGKPWTVHEGWRRQLYDKRRAGSKSDYRKHRSSRDRTSTPMRPSSTSLRSLVCEYVEALRLGQIDGSVTSVGPAL
eukprot:TRINITY_DN11712_c0_g1_i1.p2 TRINITY_DN11712_c0_g1~~TRINITY_DN11712_c0_g1_i1.p2  ORF type:complete len:107 (-),score=10.74 TRINITY_DN11712_c0_g1_i1:232-552(-)